MIGLLGWVIGQSPAQDYTNRERMPQVGLEPIVPVSERIGVAVTF
jgi:hypothetical protein